jgi:hypothetical protein
MAEDPGDQGDTTSSKDDIPSAGESIATDDDDGEEEEESEDEDDDEPKLKYARLTSHLGPVYRNGDATSTFLVAGDKMVSF